MPHALAPAGGTSSKARVAVSLTAVFVALIVAGWVAGLAATTWFDASDRFLLAFVTARRLAVLTPLVRLLSDLGSALITGPLGLLLCVLLYGNGRRVDAVFMALTVLGSLVMPEVVKVLVERARPSVVHLVSTVTYGFPSSHAAHAMAFYGAVAVVFSAGRSLWLKILVWTAAVIVIGLVGWTRLYLGVHYPQTSWADTCWRPRGSRRLP